MKIGIQISSLKPLLTTGARVHAAARRLNEIGFRYSQLQWIDPSVTPEEIAVSITGELIYTRALRREATGFIATGCPMH